MVLDREEELLVEKAKEASEEAYCPYSGFSVGASVLLDTGETVEGQNVENINFSGTVHAEGNAISAANDVEGNVEMIAIYVSPGDGQIAESEMVRAVPPCGRCRQTIAEAVLGMHDDFDMGEDEEVMNQLQTEVLTASEDMVAKFTLRKILPVDMLGSDLLSRERFLDEVSDFAEDYEVKE